MHLIYYFLAFIDLLNSSKLNIMSILSFCVNVYSMCIGQFPLFVPDTLSVRYVYQIVFPTCIMTNLLHLKTILTRHHMPSLWLQKTRLFFGRLYRPDLPIPIIRFWYDHHRFSYIRAFFTIISDNHICFIMVFLHLSHRSNWNSSFNLLFSFCRDKMS